MQNDLAGELTPKNDAKEIYGGKITLLTTWEEKAVELLLNELENSLKIKQEEYDEIIKNIKDPDYKGKEYLGEGSYSYVYRYVSETHDVVVKQIALKDKFDEKVFYLNEADILNQLESEYITRIVCSFYGLNGFIFHEFFSILTLSEAIQKPEVLDGQQKWGVAKDISKGLHYLHKQGVVHRDIKTGNVLVKINDRGEVEIKIIDFNCAIKPVRPKEYDIINKRIVQWKPKISPPEFQWKIEDVTPKGDIFLLGMVFYEMLTSQPPYLGETAADIQTKILSEQYPPLPQGVNGLLKGIIQQCWDKDPKKRPSAKEVAQNLPADGFVIKTSAHTLKVSGP